MVQGSTKLELVMKKVVINNVTYPSLAAAWREEGHEDVSFALARKRIERGWSPESALWAPPVIPQERRQFPDVRGKIDEVIDT